MRGTFGLKACSGRAIFAAVACCIATGCGAKSESATRFEDPTSGVAILVPAGWERDPETKTLAKFVGPSYGSFRPSLAITADPFRGPLEEYVQKVLKALSGHFKSYLELERKRFVTAKQAEGLRVMIEGEPFGAIVVQQCYFFDGGSRKYTVVLTRSGNPSDLLDRKFDECASSFEFKKE
jgi:hypothetical protein